MQPGVLIDDVQIKQLFKAALVEVIEERADWFSQLFLDALEDIALGRAIKEGLQTETVSREEVFKLLGD